MTDNRMNDVCKLCGASFKSDIHRMPFGRQFAFVFFTHPFEVDT